jgi:hypothetical protein
MSDPLGPPDISEPQTLEELFNPAPVAGFPNDLGSADNDGSAAPGPAL